nr:MFS transporter [Fusibacter paucivorans]
MVALILALFNFVVMIPYLGPAAMLSTIMGDLHVSVSMGGIVVSIYLIMCGLCMFVGSIICNRIGFRETFILGAALITLGLLASASAGSFGLYLLGRTISGVGYGLAQAALFPIASIWFKGSQFATMQTIITACSCLGVALAYIVFPMFGSWRTATWTFTVITLIYTIASFAWLQYPEGVGAQMKQMRADVKAGKVAKQKTEFGRVFQYKDFVLILIITIFSMISNTILLTYMVTYFTTEAGMSMTLATTVSSVLTLVQIVGAIAGGILCNTTGRRKPFIVASVAVYGIASIGLVAFGQSIVPVIACAVLSGAGYFLRMPILGMYMVEETEKPEPHFVAPISAIINGLPMLLTLPGSVIGGIMITQVGSGMTIIIMHVIALIMVIPALMLNEVGPKSKRASSKLVNA